MAVDTESYPYDTVVYITDTIGGTGFRGSGVLTSPDEVLTASHVVYTEGIGTATSVTVQPGFNDGTAPYGTVSGTITHYDPIADANDQISNDASQSDFAIIQLSDSFLANGYMGLLSNFAGGAVTVAGYPAPSTAMDVSDQTVALDPNYSLLDGITLGKGSSGGPVFVGGATYPQVVGIVSAENGTTGYDALITTATFNQIEQWVAADDAGRTWVSGTHTQYIIANDDGSLYDQDLVANRNGAQIKLGDDEIVFADGIGRFDPTGNAEEVARLYGAAFGRAADLAGLNAWTDQIDSGAMTVGNVAITFEQSAEFQSSYGSLENQGFIEQLYQNAFGQPADANGLAYWTGLLNAGASKGAVLQAISDSFEHKVDMLPTVGDKDMAETYRLYQTVFGTTSDTSGLAYWTGVLDSGSTASAVASAFAGSVEFASIFAGLDAAGIVSQLFENTFHRAADAAGVNYWVGQMQDGASVSQTVLGIADSLESRADTAGATHDAWVYTTG